MGRSLVARWIELASGIPPVSSSQTQRGQRWPIPQSLACTHIGLASFSCLAYDPGALFWLVRNRMQVPA